MVSLYGTSDGRLLLPSIVDGSGIEVVAISEGVRVTANLSPLDAQPDDDNEGNH